MSTLPGWLRADAIRCKKRLIASDGLDVEEIIKLHFYFADRIRFSAGWGTPADQ